MSETYQTNENFFICITAGDFMWPAYIFDWFYQVPAARFRLIFDTELDGQVANLKMVDDIYPGIETVGIVSNPWIKTFDAFIKLTSLRSKGVPHPLESLFKFDLSSFDNFVKQTPTFSTIPQVWFTPATTATEWTTYVDSTGKVKETKFIIRKDFMLEDFKKLQEFFCTSQPLILPEGICPPSLEYRNYYSTETKQIISRIFQDDIERFGFNF